MKAQAESEHFEARRSARAEWPIRIHRLVDEPSDEIAERTTLEERLGIAWQLTLEGWALSGRNIPDYDREHIPGRLFGAGEQRPDGDEPR